MTNHAAEEKAFKKWLGRGTETQWPGAHAAWTAACRWSEAHRERPKDGGGLALDSKTSKSAVPETTRPILRTERNDRPQR